MPVYNEKINELKDSINSILKQNYKNFEFIIVDDNPKSISIKSYLQNVFKKDNRIKVYFNKRNIGAMKSANRAMKHSHGKYIARMDADDIAYPNRLGVQLQFCIKNNLDFCSCNFSFTKDGSKQFFVYSKTLLDENKIQHLMNYTNPATGPTLFFKRNPVEKIGGYRNLLAEDYDLAVRMIVNGYKVGYLSLSLIYKRYRQNGLSETKSLSTFIVLYLIDKYSKKTKFSKILSEEFINKKTKYIRKKNIYYYRKFLHSCFKCKRSKNFVNLLRKYFWAFSTPFLLKRNLIVHKDKKIHLRNKRLYELRYQFYKISSKY